MTLQSRLFRREAIGYRALAHAVALLVLPSTATLHAQTTEQLVDASARSQLSLTIYNDDLALIRDSRRFPLASGVTRLAWREVAATIRPETASLTPRAGAFSLLEQNYDFDLLTPQALLRKYVGRDVTVTRPLGTTGNEKSEKARVLATNEGIVLRYADRIETGVAGRLSFEEVPATLRERPTLSMLLQSPKAATQEAELMYLASGINWHADYIARLDRDGRAMHLAGWVTLTNQSGTTFENAQVQLVAGTVHRAMDFLPAAAPMMARAAAPAPKMEQESLGDFHLYTLPLATTVAHQQTKQVALLSAGKIPVRREYRLWGTCACRDADASERKGLKPTSWLEFDNRDGDLGVPLPAGVVRVYNEDARGGAQFIGEDRIAHTAKNETIALQLGEAFDLTAERRQTRFELTSKRSAESSHRIEVRNASETATKVIVREAIGNDWTLVSSTLPSTKPNGGTAQWIVDVPANGKRVLEYTVSVRW